MLGIGIYYFDRRKFFILTLLFFLFLVLFFASFPWKDGSLTGRTIHRPVWSSTPPCEGVSPFWGPLALLALCVPEEKRPSPGRGARKPPRVKRVLPLSGWPQVPSGVPGVLFPFFREDVTSSPSEYKRLPPSGENPKTHGAPAGQDSVPQGGSQGRARSAVEKSRIASQVIN